VSRADAEGQKGIGAPHYRQKKKKRQKKICWVGVACRAVQKGNCNLPSSQRSMHSCSENLVLSVWSVVFVGTTEHTEYTEGRARRRVFSTSLWPIILDLRQSAVTVRPVPPRFRVFYETSVILFRPPLTYLGGSILSVSIRVNPWFLLPPAYPSPNLRQSA
jgi:hypothetical protein